MTTDTETADDQSSSSSGGPIRITIEVERPSTIIAELGPHARGAAREALLTLRGALDLALRFVDDEHDGPPPTGPARIKIE